MHETALRRPASSLAWTGVLLGLVGLFTLNLVFGPIAIGLGATAYRRDAHRGIAAAAIVLGAVDVILEVVLATLWLSHGLVWHFGG
jgi:hypothetical protein